MPILTILIALSLLATILSMVWGVITMGFGDKKEDEKSEKLMSARVIFQLVTIILLAIAGWHALIRHL